MIYIYIYIYETQWRVSYLHSDAGTAQVCARVRVFWGPLQPFPFLQLCIRVVSFAVGGIVCHKRCDFSRQLLAASILEEMTAAKHVYILETFASWALFLPHGVGLSKDHVAGSKCKQDWFGPVLKHWPQSSVGIPADWLRPSCGVVWRGWYELWELEHACHVLWTWPRCLVPLTS